MRLLCLLVVPALGFSGISWAPTAAADCTSAGGTTICSQGEVRGASGGGGPSSSGPYVPYPCTYDWYCDDNYGLTIDIGNDWNPGRPGRPGGGGGGRPGDGGGGGRGGR